MQDEAGRSFVEKNVETDDSERSDSSYVRIVDAAYKKRVMDDLDALLADLQSTTATISSYQNSQRHQHHQQQPQHQTPPPPSSSSAANHVNSQIGYARPQDQAQYSHNNGNSNDPRYHHQQYQQHRPPPAPSQQQYHHHHHNHLQQQHQQQVPGPPTLPYPNNQYPPPPHAATAPPGTTHVYYTVEAVNSELQGHHQGQGDGSYGYAYHSGGDEDSALRRASGASTPPPLPPPPPSEVLDSLAHAQRQEIVSLHHHPNSNSNNPTPFHPQQQYHQQQAAPEEYDNEVQTRSEAKGRGERMSALSNNLSELDQLLQDLNSAQFMAEVDRKSTVNDIPVVMNGNTNGISGSGGVSSLNKPPPPQVAPKPKRNTVDSLLDDLETTPKFPVESPYQELGPVNHSQHPSSSSSSSSGYPPQSASSATKELDDLMMSLSEFKVQDKESAHLEGGGEPTYAKPMKVRTPSATSPTSPPPHGSQAPTQLESMLGDLQSDMTRQGVNTKQKGVCAACNKPIVGQVIAALGQTWHIEHFTCAHCEEPLGTRNFYERDGMAYCETDYHHLFAPRCAYCNGPIVDKCITALEKMWHPEHFFCAQCGHPFGEEDFHEKNGKAYCRDDYFAMFAPKCGGCGQPIMENYISALNRQWHPECFVCWDCRAPFGAGSFFDYEGLPYCETHYHAKKGSLCASCEKPITGRCITAMFKKFHPEHFVCAFCLKQLNKGTFKEQNDKPYCHPCFVKLFG